DRAGTGDRDALARDKAAQLRQAVHRRAGSDDQGRLLVRHLVGDADQRVDVIDLILAEAPIGGEPVGAMALIDVTIVHSVIVTRRIHTFAAALALPASGMDLDRHPVADAVLVDTGAERHHSAHVLVTWRIVLVE